MADEGDKRAKGMKKEDMMERLDYLNRLARGEASESGSATSSDEESEGGEVEEEEDEDEGADSRKLEEGDIPMGEQTRYRNIIIVVSG